MIVCPYFNDELCSIYDQRPQCCRSFPNRTSGMFCADSKCDEDCISCKDKCCRHIEGEGTDVFELLNISCSECQNKYCLN